MEKLNALLSHIDTGRFATIPAFVAYAISLVILMFILTRRAKKLSEFKRLVNLKVKLDHGMNAVLSDKGMRLLTAKFRRGTRLRVYAVLLVTLGIVYFVLPALPLPGQETRAAVSALPEERTETAPEPESAETAETGETKETEIPAEDPEKAVYDRYLAEVEKEAGRKLLKDTLSEHMIPMIIAGVLLLLTIAARGIPRIWLGVIFSILAITVGISFTISIQQANGSSFFGMLDRASACYEAGEYADAYACASVLLRESKDLGEFNLCRLVSLKALAGTAMRGEAAVDLRKWEMSKIGIFNYGTDLYGEEKYAAAEALWREMLDAGYPETFGSHKYSNEYTRHDLLNNLALAEMQMGRNEEALAAMRRIFEEGTSDEHYIINLLVTAEANGIPASVILAETGADELLAEWNKQYNPKEPGSQTKVRTAVGYNIAWMDMELPEEEYGLAVPIAGTIYSEENGHYRRIDPFESRKGLLRETQHVLENLNDSEESCFGEKDPDVTALRIYLLALLDGGVPQAVSGE